MKATTSVTASRMAPMLSRCPSPDRCRSASRKVYARAVNAMWRCSPGYEVRRVGRDESSGVAVPHAVHVGVGFDDEEITRLIAGLAAEESADLDDPGAEPPPAVAVAKPGDLWILGNHRLLCGDSTRIERCRGFSGDETLCSWSR